MTLESSITLVEHALISRLEELFPVEGKRRSEGSRKPVSGSRTQLGQLAQRAAPSVHNLWQLFNARRPEKMPKYMDNPDYCRAYLAAFLLPNLVKLGHLLLNASVRTEIVARLKSRDRRTTKGPKEAQASQKGPLTLKGGPLTHNGGPLTLTMVDYGAGPLTATLAMALVLAEISQSADFETNKSSKSKGPKHPLQLKLKSIVVESGDDIFAAGELLLDQLREHLFDSGIEVEIVRASLRSAEHFGPAESDIVIAANALNELSSSTRRDLQKFIGRCIDHKALVLVVEPGQDTHSKTMAAFRDSLLESHPDANILGPCPHRQSCPLGPNSAKPDWCWFRMQWQPTNWTTVLDERTGLKHSDLNFCYFIMGPKAKSTVTAPWGRIVSDRINLETSPVAVRRRLLTYLKTNSPQRSLPFEDKVMLNGPLSKTLVCTREGTLVGVYDKLENGPLRGESVETKPKSVWIAPERTTATKKSAPGPKGRGIGKKVKTRTDKA